MNGSAEKPEREPFDPERYANVDIEVDFGPVPLAAAAHVYTPFLWTKEAEQKALRGVSKADRMVMAPLMMVRPPAKRGPNVGKDAAGKNVYGPPPTYEQHIAVQANYLRDVCTDAMDVFGRFNRLFVEVSALQEKSPTRSVLSDLFTALGGTWNDLVPVTDPLRSLPHQNAVKRWHAQAGTGVGLRIRGASAWPSLEDIVATLDHVGCRSEDADLILDLESVCSRPLAPLASSATAAITTYAARTWRRIVVASAGFPDTIKDFPFKRTPVIRADVALWLAVTPALRAQGGQSIYFGDYGPLGTEFVEGGGPVEVFPNIRYADTQFWLVYRREAREEVREMCEVIVNDFPDVPARANSGDRWIAAQVQHGKSPGNPARWVRVGLAHHIWFVVRQMNGLP